MLSQTGKSQPVYWSTVHWSTVSWFIGVQYTGVQAAGVLEYSSLEYSLLVYWRTVHWSTVSCCLGVQYTVSTVSWCIGAQSEQSAGVLQYSRLKFSHDSQWDHSSLVSRESSCISIQYTGVQSLHSADDLEFSQYRKLVYYNLVHWSTVSQWIALANSTLQQRPQCSNSDLYRRG